MKMKLPHIKEQKGTLRKLSNLLTNPDKKVHGVHYTNTYFDYRHVSRSQVNVNKLEVEKDTVTMTVTTRVETSGITEVEDTLNLLVENKAGDVPNIDILTSPKEDEAVRVEVGVGNGEGGEDTRDKYELELDDEVVAQLEGEMISVNQTLVDVDILIRMDSPEVSYKDFTIAGNKFTLVQLHQPLSEGVELYQTVNILFGDADKLYFLSHFYNKKLNTRDASNLIDLLVDGNILGKVVSSVTYGSTVSGCRANLYPMNSLITPYRNLQGVIMFATDTGYIRLDEGSLKNFEVTCYPINDQGDYVISLQSKNEILLINLD